MVSNLGTRDAAIPFDGSGVVVTVPSVCPAAIASDRGRVVVTFTRLGRAVVAEYRGRVVITTRGDRLAVVSRNSREILCSPGRRRELPCPTTAAPPVPSEVQVALPVLMVPWLVATHALTGLASPFRSAA